jgi:MFS family permease
VLFHFANAAMLPLLGEMLAKGHGRSSMMFMSACVVTTAVGIGAALSQSIAGSIVHRFGYHAGFLFLAAVAAATSPAAKLSNPGCFMSGVRIRGDEQSLARSIDCTRENWCRLRDYSALRASPLRGRPAGVEQRPRRSCRNPVV